eukprot:GILI01002296.1.p1 GENE.GILI01002296.1~~GILI01002296.1.p1  ORF type:complete len:652 (+),score=208.26 GILI01002296.1:111-2066(+)
MTISKASPRFAEEEEDKKLAKQIRALKSHRAMLKSGIMNLSQSSSVQSGGTLSASATSLSASAPVTPLTARTTGPSPRTHIRRYKNPAEELGDNEIDLQLKAREKELQTALSGGDDGMSDQIMMLAQLKKKYDDIKNQLQQRSSDLQLVKEEVEAIDRSTRNRASEDVQIEKSSQYLENQLEITKLKHEEALASKRVYEHMLDRMKSEKMALEQKIHALERCLRVNYHSLEDAAGLMRSTKEDKTQNQLKLEAMRQALELERQQRADQLKNLERILTERREASLRRQEQHRQQLEAAEAAANEDEKMSEGKLKKMLVAKKLWSSFLKKKMEREMHKSMTVEDAFQKIRQATGLTDVNEIVHKFLTREQTYNQLLTAVADAEAKIESLKQEQNALKQQAQEAEFSSHLGSGNRSIYQEVETHDAQLARCLRDLQQARDRLQRSVVLVDHIKSWMQRMMTKLDPSASLLKPGGAAAASGGNASSATVTISGNVPMADSEPSSSSSAAASKSASQLIASLKDRPLLEQFAVLEQAVDMVSGKLKEDDTEEETRAMVADLLKLQMSSGPVKYDAEFSSRNIRIRPLSVLGLTDRPASVLSTFEGDEDLSDNRQAVKTSSSKLVEETTRKAFKKSPRAKDGKGKSSTSKSLDKAEA